MLTLSSRSASIAFIGLAATFAITMMGTTLPTPLYPIYQDRLGFSELMITVIFAVYAAGVIAALIITGLILAGVTAGAGQGRAHRFEPEWARSPPPARRNAGPRWPPLSSCSPMSRSRYRWVGLGLIARALDLVTAGVAFASAVALLSLLAAVSLLIRQRARSDGAVS